MVSRISDPSTAQPKDRIQPPIVFTAGKGRILRACRCFKQGQLIFQVSRFFVDFFWVRKWCVNYQISKSRYPPGYIYIYIDCIYPIPAGKILKMMFRTSQMDMRKFMLEKGRWHQDDIHRTEKKLWFPTSFDSFQWVSGRFSTKALPHQKTGSLQQWGDVSSQYG